MKLLVSSVAIAILLSGCFQSESNNKNENSKEQIKDEKNINLVKNGAMDFDKTLTVGQAFDNWRYCSNKVWSNFTTDNGRKVVQFECNNMQVSQFIADLLKSQKLTNENLDYLNIKNIKLQVQWTLNIDNTFQLHNINEYIIWKNGFKVNQNVDSLFLKKIYDNKNYFENNYLDEQKIKFYASKFYKEHKVEIDKKKIEQEYISDVKKYLKNKNIFKLLTNVSTIDELYNVVKNKKNKETYILQSLIFNMMSFNSKSLTYLPASKYIIDLIVQDENLNLKGNIFTFFLIINMNPEWADKTSIIQDTYLNEIIRYMIRYPKIVNLMKTNALDSKRNIFGFYMLFDKEGSKETIKTYEQMINKGIDPTISELGGFETIDTLKTTNLFKKLQDIQKVYIQKYGNEIISKKYIISYDLNKKTTKKVIIEYKSTVSDYFNFMVTSDLDYTIKGKWKEIYMNNKSKSISKKAIKELFLLIKPKFIEYNIKVEIDKK